MIIVNVIQQDNISSDSDTKVDNEEILLQLFEILDKLSEKSTPLDEDIARLVDKYFWELF